MKYYIHNLTKNTYFVVQSLEEMIEWFARHNQHDVEYTKYGKYSWMSKRYEKPIDPNIHHWQRYNTALSDVAMHINDIKHEFHWVTGEATAVRRGVMVLDEYNRVIDPRHYWKQIAVAKPKYRYKGKKKDHEYVYRFDPVPRTAKLWRGGKGYYRRPRTTQERRKAADPEIKQYVKPKRSFLNLPNTWDDIHRNRDHCWKAKKINKQWMKHQ